MGWTNIMNDGLWEWSVEDQEQCWWDLVQVWNLDGFNAALIHSRDLAVTSIPAEGQLMLEVTWKAHPLPKVAPQLRDRVSMWEQ